MIALKRIFGTSVNDETHHSEHDEQQTNKFYKIKRAGTNYELAIDITGEAPYSTCVISINAVAGQEKKLPIAARYSWKKYARGCQEQDINSTSNTMHLSPLDAGCFIKVYVTPIEEDTIYSEVSSVVFGPIVLDPQTKRTIQGIMRAGGFKFQVDRFLLPEAEDYAVDGSIILSQNCFHLISRKSPKQPLRVMLSDRFRIISQRNHFKMFTIEFASDNISHELSRFFGCPYNRNLRRIKFHLSSMNTKDLLILSINLFRCLMNFKELELLETVSSYVKDAPPATEFKEDADDDGSSEDTEAKRVPTSPSDELPDAIDKLFLNKGLKEEIVKLYSANQKLAIERNQLQMKVVNMESELTRSINRSTGASDIEPTRVVQDVDMSMVDTNKLRGLKQKNTDISENIKAIETQNSALRLEVDRLTKIFKQMRYKELMDSKLNATARRPPQQDISNLERALQDYAQEYKKLLEQIGHPQVIAESDSERSLSLVDEMEERALEMLMKNERLKDEVEQYRALIQEAENRKEAKATGVSFIGNESFLRPSQQRNQQKMEFEIQVENLDNRIQRLTLENKDLNEQISKLKAKLNEQDENDQQVKIYRKLKMQQTELSSILDDKKRKINELQNIRSRLGDQENFMKSSTYHDESQVVKIQQLKARKEHLEKTHKLLAKELDDQKAFTRRLDEEHQEVVRHYSSLGSPMPTPSPTSVTIERMKATVRELEDKIAQLEKERRHPPEPAPTSDLSAAEVKQIENEKKMNERLITEIIRLNEVIKLSSAERDSTLL